MSFASQLLPCLVLTLLQFVAAVPWLQALDPKSFRTLTRRTTTWFNVVGSIIGITVVGAILITFQRGSGVMELAGRVYGSVLHLQLVIDVFIGAFALLLLLWPKGGAVALSAFREGVRQPMFWLIALFAGVVFLIAMLLPYFTFGDDYKMMKQICFDVTMLGALVFGVLAASISINEEIEGRTAVTLMSKPVTRRQFLIGKYIGILAAALALTLFVGWFMNWVLFWQPKLNPMDEVIDPMTAQAQGAVRSVMLPVTTGDSLLFMKGLTLWTGDAIANGLGTLLGFGKVMVLLAVAVALATRMPMITNLLLCVAVFALGHLAPVLRRVSEEMRLRHQESTSISLVNFLTQLLETVTPSLEFFDMGPAVIRDTPINLTAFSQYVASAGVTALLYTAIALLFGLILFEDRDLA